MATSRPKSGVNEYSITTGPGPLTLTGPVPGFRGFISADDGAVFPYGIYQEGIAFETGIGTYTHSSRQLSRATVLANINNTTVPLTLGNGTKEVSIVIPGERVVMGDVENQFLEDQFLNGKRLNMDADHDSYIAMQTDDTLDVVLGNSNVLYAAGGIGAFIVLGSDDTASEGPIVTLRRDSASPAAFDALASLYWQGRVAGGALQYAAKIRAHWTSVTAGAFSSALEFAVANAGALQTVLTVAPSRFTVATGIQLFTAGKTVGSATTVGAEMNSDGSIAGITNGTTPVYISRNGSGTELISLSTGATQVSSVTVSGGNVNWATFTGSHWSEWAGTEAEEHRGTIVATAPGLLDAPVVHLPLVRLATAGDQAVFGVIVERMSTSYGREQGNERSLLLIAGLGTSQIRCLGPIVRGNLLRVSATPGVAEAQLDDIVRSTTVAKATQDSTDDGGERLVPCVLMAG